MGGHKLLVWADIKSGSIFFKKKMKIGIDFFESFLKYPQTRFPKKSLEKMQL